jgi:ABC-type spermidine/putrescine transport system permease subunit II
MIITLVLAAILVPLVPLVLWSFADTWPFVQVLPNFSLRAWISTFQNSKVVGALINSLILCVVIVVLSFSLSFFAAKNIGTREFKGKRLLQLLLLVPSFFPQIALVFGMQKVFSKIGLYNNIVGVVVALLVFYVPYMTLLMSAVFEDYDLDLERQAASLGVRPLKRLFFVTLPAVRSGAIVSCIFSFIGVWAAYLVVSIVAPPSFKTMSLLAFPMISSASNGYAMTACVTILYIAPIIGVLAVFSRCLANDTSRPEDSKPGGIM